MSAHQAEARINRALRPFRLVHFADSAEWRAVCGAKAVPPARLVRHAPDGKVNAVAATELTLIRPLADASRLEGLLAQMVRDAVMAG